MALWRPPGSPPVSVAFAHAGDRSASVPHPAPTRFLHHMRRVKGGVSAWENESLASERFVSISARIPKDIKEALQKKGVNLSQIVREYLQEYVRNDGRYYPLREKLRLLRELRKTANAVVASGAYGPVAGNERVRRLKNMKAPIHEIKAVEKSHIARERLAQSVAKDLEKLADHILETPALSDGDDPDRWTNDADWNAMGKAEWWEDEDNVRQFEYRMRKARDNDERPRRQQQW